jgi:hypothetical protein
VAGAAWVGYGLVEYAYARGNPEDWAMLLARYSHTYYALEMSQDAVRTRYLASMCLARSLAALASQQSLAHRMGPGAGRWSYNKPISFLALPPGGAWDSRATWAASGLDMAGYMPAQRPR